MPNGIFPRRRTLLPSSLLVDAVDAFFDVGWQSSPISVVLPPIVQKLPSLSTRPTIPEPILLTELNPISARNSTVIATVIGQIPPRN
jgi:hypothetical protein